MGQLGTGFDLNGDLAALTFHLFHKVAGLADGGHQFGYHFPAGAALVAGIAFQQTGRIVVAGGHGSHVARVVVGYVNLRIHPQMQYAAIGQFHAGNSRGRGSAASQDKQRQSQRQQQGQILVVHLFHGGSSLLYGVLAPFCGLC